MSSLCSRHRRQPGHRPRDRPRLRRRPATRSPSPTAPASRPRGCSACAATSPTRPSVDAAFTEVEAEHGPVEVLVANAGITRDTLLLRMTEEDFTAVLDANLAGAFRVAKRATQAACCGSSAAGSCFDLLGGRACSARPGQANYAASKAGLVGFARSHGPRARLARHHRQRRRARASSTPT